MLTATCKTFPCEHSSRGSERKQPLVERHQVSRVKTVSASLDSLRPRCIEEYVTVLFLIYPCSGFSYASPIYSEVCQKLNLRFFEHVKNSGNPGNLSLYLLSCYVSAGSYSWGLVFILGYFWVRAAHFPFIVIWGDSLSLGVNVCPSREGCWLLAGS